MTEVVTIHKHSSETLVRFDGDWQAVCDAIGITPKEFLQQWYDIMSPSTWGMRDGDWHPALHLSSVFSVGDWVIVKNGQVAGWASSDHYDDLGAK